MVATNTTVPFVLSDTPRSGSEIVLFSTKPRGIDVIIPRASVNARWALNGYVKYDIEGTTDKGGKCHVVARTSDTNPDELKVLEVNFS